MNTERNGVEYKLTYSYTILLPMYVCVCMVAVLVCFQAWRGVAWRVCVGIYFWRKTARCSIYIYYGFIFHLLLSFFLSFFPCLCIWMDGWVCEWVVRLG